MQEPLSHGRMHDDIRLMWECRHTCQETLYNHCLTQGGPHVEAHHLRAMMDCIAICQVAADFMTRYSASHQAICAACADVCEACADSCAQIDDDAMQQCAEICRRCARVCRDNASVVGEATG